MDASNILGLTSSTASSAQAQGAPAQKQLGQQDFLALMLAQLKNQDPFKPLQSGEFLSQLAQFSTVNGIQVLQQSFDRLGASLQSMQALQASGLVGREVLVNKDQGYLAADGTLNGVVSLPEAAASVKVDFYNGANQLVREIDLGAQPAGRASFSWDGNASNGSRAPEGTYKVQVQAMVGGQPVNVTPMVRAKVDSVTVAPAGQGMVLNLAGMGPLDFQQVSEIF